MNADPDTDGERYSAERYASGLSRRQFFTLVFAFWAYVTLSNVLYAYGMRTGIAKSPTWRCSRPGMRGCCSTCCCCRW